MRRVDAHRFADAIRAHSHQVAMARETRAEYARVITARPNLSAEATDANMVYVEGEDLVLGHTPEQFDANYGIRPGDLLCVHHMRNGDVLAVDVVTKRPHRRWLFRDEWLREDNQR